MALSNRAEFLRNLGYKEPFDKSPVEVPEGWRGGAVENTGGNIMCRVWRTWKPGERSQDTEYEVIYNVSESATVGLQAYTWDDSYDGYMFDHEIRDETSKEHSDLMLAEVAKELMDEHVDDL